LKQVSAIVISNSEVMPDVYLIWLESPQIASIAQPGQFVMVRCGEESLLRRPLGVHRLDKAKMALLFSVVGKGTYWLAQRQAGDTVDLLGPMGNGFSVHPDSHNLLLVAGGIGIAPLRFLIDKTLEQGKEVTLLLGAQTSSHLYPESLLPPDIRLAKTTEDGSAGEKGMITDSFRGFISFTVADQIFACGPAPMYRAMAAQKQRLLAAKSVQVSLEMRMGCGLGTCYGCTLRTKHGLKQVCKDGPVFELDDIFWDDPAFNC